MSPTHHSKVLLRSQARNRKLLCSAATLMLSLFYAAADDPMQEWVTSSAAVSAVRLGDSSDAIAKKIEPLWFGLDAPLFLRQEPFRVLVPYTNVAVMTEWKSRKDTWDGRPRVLFAVFSDPRKTNLVDALLHDGYGLNPVVEGLFDKNVKSIRTGDSMERIFRLLGRRECEYFLATGGKWRIKVLYPTSKGEQREFEADAGSGKVLKVTTWKPL